jgi:alditol oxidase
LHDTVSYPHINVIGAIVTGSHGGGKSKGSFAYYVTAFEMVTAKGEVIWKTDKDKDFADYLFTFGNIGIFTKMQMKVRDRYSIKKCYYG